MDITKNNPVKPPNEPWKANPVKPPNEPWLVKLDDRTQIMTPW